MSRAHKDLDPRVVAVLDALAGPDMLERFGSDGPATAAQLGHRASLPVWEVMNAIDLAGASIASWQRNGERVYGTYVGLPSVSRGDGA